MSRLIGYVRKVAVLGAVVAAGWTWADTFKKSAATKDWAGNIWGVKTPTEGRAIDNGGRDIETEADRKKREKRLLNLDTGLGEAVRGVKRDVLGNGEKLRGDTIHVPRMDMPWAFDNLPPRQVCLQQQLEFPDRFGTLDCMGPDYDDDLPTAPPPEDPFEKGDAGAPLPD